MPVNVSSGSVQLHPKQDKPMSTVRDPRVDPRPRDVLKRGKRMRTIVPVIPLGRTGQERNWVAFKVPSRPNVVTQERPDIFAEWARSATLVTCAEEGA